MVLKLYVIASYRQFAKQLQLKALYHVFATVSVPFQAQFLRIKFYANLITS
jgi:hypothetical protein